MRHQRSVVAAVVVVASLSTVAGSQPPDVAGTWEYRQANRARPDGLDAEGERLVVVRHADGRQTGHYFGLERTGDHGLLYTAVDLGPLLVGLDGRIAFTVPARTLYRSRPPSLAGAARLPSAGRTTEVLAFSGRIAGSTLLLTCTSAPGACPDSRLVFRRVVAAR